LMSCYPCSQVTYQGFDNVNSIFNAEGSAYRLPYPPELLLELVLVKIASTSLCRQSGLVGGVYAPSLFMGAALG
jgi:H+/Cl- antiporter ClcA